MGKKLKGQRFSLKKCHFCDSSDSYLSGVRRSTPFVLVAGVCIRLHINYMHFSFILLVYLKKFIYLCHGFN